jgi:hypothetical protein
MNVWGWDVGSLTQSGVFEEPVYLGQRRTCRYLPKVVEEGSGNYRIVMHVCILLLLTSHNYVPT